MKNALVTGVTGQDGPYLARDLLDKGYKVFGTYRRVSTPNFWRLQSLGILNRITLINNSIADVSPYNHSGIELPSEALSSFRDYGTIGDLFIEGNSQYADKQKGARLRYRYINGVLTNQELWPWPMEERIRIELAREFGIQNYSVTNTIVPLINQYTAQQVPLGSGSPTPSVTPSPSPNPADVNGSGGVDFNDLKLVLSNWLGISTCATFICDLNSDSKINALDASLVIVNFGK